MKKIIPIFGYLIFISYADAQQFPAYQLFINVNGVPTAVTSTLTSGQIPTPPAILAKCVNAGVIVDCNFNGGGGGGGLSGQTPNFLPLATSATTSTTSSDVQQLGGGQIRIGSAVNVAPSQDPTFDVRRVVGSVVSHGVSVDDVLSGGINPYAAFDSRLEVTGAFNIDHYAGYQDIPTVDVGYSGTLNNLINFVGYANINGGTVTTRYGFEANDVITSGSGSVGTQYGIYVNPLTHAGVNHGLYVAANDSFLGGNTTIGNTAAPGNIMLGKWGTAGSYNALTFNGDLTNVQGFVASGPTDPNLYVFIPGGSLEMGAMTRIDIDTSTPLVWHGDLGLSRDAAGILDVGNGTLGDKSGSMKMTNLTLTGTCTGCGSGVTAIGVTTANGVSGTSSGGSTPNLTITLGAITPTTVNSMLVTGNSGGGSVFIGFGISTTSAVNGNTCIGSLSCDSIAGGGTTSSITAIGINAYRSNAGGNDNVAIGDTSLYNIGTPTFDVAIGSQAGRSNNTSGSVFVGYHAQLTGAANNVNLIGANTSGSTANQTILGNTSITTTILGGALNLTSSDGFQSSGTTFTVTGCGTATSLTGGGTAGSFVGASASCTPVITTGLTAAHGWACHMNDFTTSTAAFRQTATTTTTATFTAGGTVGGTDTINFLCMGY